MASRGNWGSKTGFILAASGSAVGLGNIWRFPYTAGQNGGALFVLIYLVSIIMIAFPVLLAEITLGRHTQRNPVGAYDSIKPGSRWKLLGYLGVVTGVMILSFYAMIAGWTIGYFYKAVTGKLSQITSLNTDQVYSTFTGNIVLQLLLVGLFLFLTIFIVSKGVSGGIERLAKVLMPALFVIMLFLLVRSLTLPGASKGLSFFLKPDFSALSPKVILEGMGQAFFSLSLGMGTMITYGSYINKKENLPSAGGWVAFFDTFIAILAGFIIFPALFSQGMDPAGGPGLVFNVLPVIFAKMPGGIVFGSFFFALLSIAALTSTVSLLEVPVAFLIDEKKWKRRKAAIIMGSITLVFGVPSVLSEAGVPFFNNLPLINTSFFGLWDLLWSNLSLSIGAFFIAIFVGYIWKTNRALKEIAEGSSGFRLAKFWVISIKYISPILIILILIGILL